MELVIATAVVALALGLVAYVAVYLFERFVRQREPLGVVWQLRRRWGMRDRGGSAWEMSEGTAEEIEKWLLGQMQHSLLVFGSSTERPTAVVTFDSIEHKWSVAPLMTDYQRTVPDLRVPWSVLKGALSEAKQLEGHVAQAEKQRRSSEGLTTRSESSQFKIRADGEGESHRPEKLQQWQMSGVRG